LAERYMPAANLTRPAAALTLTTTVVRPDSRPVVIPRLYARKYLGRIIVQATLILLMIELIFIAEKLNDVLRAAADQDVSTSGILLLLLYRTPEIFNVAAPLALLAAIYRVTLRFREERELLALSGVGVGPYRLLFLTCGVGIAAQCLSLAVGGFITPAAVFAQRSLLFESSVAALRGGITSGQFYWFGDYTIFARRGRETSTRQLFLHQSRANQAGEDRIVIARRASLDGPRADGVLVLKLQDFDSFNFRPPASNLQTPNVAAAGRSDCAACSTASPAEPTSIFRVANYEQHLELDDLLRFDPRGHNASEWTLADILGFGSPALVAGEKQIAEFGHRLSRSLLCIVAPLLAGLALALTTRRTQAIALPFACGALMGIDLSMSFLSDEMARLGLAVLTLVLLLATAFVFILTIGVGWKWQDGIVRPALVRA